MVRVRFAPSPTGLLHVGGARTALFNFIYAKKHNGKLILRIDDTDKERSLKENEEDILSSLKWLGIDWDEGPNLNPEGPYEPYYQSKRLSKHLDFAEELKKTDLAYVDDENCVRLRYPKTDIVFKDEVCGECRFAPNSLGPDPVIIRSNGMPTYHLASVSDDIDFKITHIIRGQDHLTNTAKHVVLYRAAGVNPPVFAHLPLLLGEDGSKLSKRNSMGFTCVRDFIKEGYVPEALINLLCLLGWSHPEGKELFTLDEVIDSFSFDRVGQSGAKFEISKLDWFNGQYIRQMSPEELFKLTLDWSSDWNQEITTRGVKWWSSAIYDLRTDIVHLKDIPSIASLLLSENIDMNEEAKEHFSNEENKNAFESVKTVFNEVISEIELEDGADCFTKEQTKLLIKTIKKRASVPPKLVFQSIRVLVTGALKGPELDILLTHIPHNVIRCRISQ